MNKDPAQKISHWDVFGFESSCIQTSVHAWLRKECDFKT